MIVQVPINDIFANGSNDEELQREIKEGLATRKHPPDLETIAVDNMNRLAKRLGV